MRSLGDRSLWAASAAAQSIELFLQFVGKQAAFLRLIDEKRAQVCIFGVFRRVTVTFLATLAGLNQIFNDANPSVLLCHSCLLSYRTRKTCVDGNPGSGECREFLRPFPDIPEAARESCARRESRTSQLLDECLSTGGFVVSQRIESWPECFRAAALPPHIPDVN